MTALFHGTLTRRHFLGTSAAALAASALPSAASAQGARFRRFEISDPGMPPRVLDSYKKGIREMLNRPATDPRNWYRNAFIHVFDCPHQNWWFLAWHRAYIGWLEAAIRAFSGDAEFALPYWDWTKTPRVPAAMFDDVLDPNNAAFIPTFDAFKAQFDAPVTALFAAFSQAQQDVLAQRGLSSTADFWSAVAAAPAGMFFEQPGARGLTPASPDLDRTTRSTVALSTIRSALRTANFAGSASGADAAGFASAKAFWKASPTTTCTAPWAARRATPSWCRSCRRSIRSSSCTTPTWTGCGTCGRAGKPRSDVRRCRKARISQRGRTSSSYSSAMQAASRWRRPTQATTPR